MYPAARRARRTRFKIFLTIESASAASAAQCAFRRANPQFDDTEPRENRITRTR
ncbi:hypothetical protein MYA_0106 [Burkholderia sp. KJ006]|jgi:hypothetical protein|nr:hypothetical protein MYA_0106 [Burkholderia sp. KJ006]